MGGRAAFIRTMAETRVTMNLSIPSRAVLDKALEMIDNGQLEIPL